VSGASAAGGARTAESTGGCRGSVNEGDERGVGLERRDAEELVEAQEEPPEVHGEVVSGLRGLDGGGQLRALVLLVEHDFGERGQRRGRCAHGGGTRRSAAARSLVTSGATASRECSPATSASSRSECRRSGVLSVAEVVESAVESAGGRAGRGLCLKRRAGK
jgi:hypothetical protein